jgi:hypothetical protein
MWVLGVLCLAAYVTLPFFFPWGWVRWVKGANRRSVCAVLSFIGFAFASLSCLFAVVAAVCASPIGGFAYYDPLPMRISQWGFKLSLAEFVFAIGGVWRSNPLRWHAPACAFGMLLVWFGAAMAE